MPVVRDGLLQDVLHVLLEPEVDVGDHGVALDRVRPAEGADHLALGINGERVLARSSAQVLLVLVLQPVLPVLAGLGVAAVRVVLELGGRDGTDVAEDRRGHEDRGSVLRVGAVGHLLHGDPGVLGLVRLEVLDGVHRGIAEHRDGFVLAVLRIADGLLYLMGGLTHQGGDLTDDGGVVERRRAGQEDLLLRHIAGDDGAVAVDDLPARRGDADDADLVARDRRGEGLSVNDLQCPQAQHQHEEQGDHNAPHDANADVGAGGLVLGRSHQRGDIDALARAHPWLARAGPPRRGVLAWRA